MKWTEVNRFESEKAVKDYAKSKSLGRRGTKLFASGRIELRFRCQQRRQFEHCGVYYKALR